MGPQILSPDFLAPGLIRIYGGNGVAVGAGVLVDGGHVLTCAHVVALALALDGSKETPQDPPTGTLDVDFPGLVSPAGDAPRVTAQVVAEGWCPIEADGRRGDVAVLKLDQLPEGAEPPPFRGLSGPSSSRVMAYGYPLHYQGDSVISINEVSGGAGPARDWVQLDHVKGFRADEVHDNWTPDQPLENVVVCEGFSGAPVWDCAGGVIGIVAVAERNPNQGTAFMIPVSGLAEVWPSLDESIGWRLRFDDQRDLHWRPTARGMDDRGDRGDYFTGRLPALRELVGWMGEPDGRARIVTGEAGSGKSAVLARLVMLADRDREPGDGDDKLRDGTVPPPGSVDLAIVATDMTLTDVVEAMARWFDVEAASAGALVDELARRAVGGSLPLIVVDQLDQAVDPARLVDLLLLELVEKGAARLVVGLRRTDDCPLARLLAPQSETLDLDGAYLDAKDVFDYVNEILAKRDPAGGDEGEDAVPAVARAIAEGAGKSFLVAQLSALWERDHGDFETRPRDAYPSSVAEAMNRYVSGLAGPQNGGEDELRDLLTALAFARGSGLPVAGPVWPALAGAIRERDHDPDRTGWLLGTAARYLLRIADVGGVARVKLFHPALVSCLHDERDAEQVEPRIAKRLSALCSATDAAPADDYVARHLAEHVAAAAAWDELARQPHVLDRLDPRSVCATAVASGSELQGDSLPAEIVGVVQSERLMANGLLTDRAGLRQLGMARAVGLRRFRAKDAAPAITAWTVHSAVVRRHPVHLTLDAPSAVCSIATFPGTDGAPVLAAGCADGSVRLWSAVTGEPFGDALLGDPSSHDDGVRALTAYEPAAGGVRLVVGGADGQARIWAPLSRGEPLAFATGHDGGIRAIAAFAVDGALRVVTAGAGGDVRIWDAGGTPLGVLPSVGSVRALAAPADDGHVRIAAAGDASVYLWDLDGERLSALSDGDPAESRELIGPLDWIRALGTFGADGDLHVVAAGDDASLAIWRLAENGSGPWLRVPGDGPAHDGPVLGVAAYTDSAGPRVATGGADAGVALWDAADGTRVGEPLVGHGSAVTAVTAYEVDHSTRLASGSDDRTVRIWNPASVAQAADRAARHADRVLAVAVTSDGAVVTGSSDGSIRAWDSASGEPLGDPHRSGAGTVRALAACPGGVAVAGDDEVVCFVDPVTGNEVAAPLTGHGGPIRALVTDIRVEDVPALATGSDDGTVRLWRADDGVEIEAARSAHRGPIRGLAALRVQGQDCLAVVGADRTFSLRRVGAAGAVGEPFRGHTDWPMAVCAYAREGGTWLFTAADDGKVRRWNAITQNAQGVCGVHDGPVRALFARSHGEDLRIVSGGDDRTVRVWDPDAPAGEREIRRMDLDARVNGLLAIGERILVGTDEGHLVVDLDWG
jgi:WD40 repeat protein